MKYSAGCTRSEECIQPTAHILARRRKAWGIIPFILYIQYIDMGFCITAKCVCCVCNKMWYFILRCVNKETGLKYRIYFRCGKPILYYAHQ